MEERGIEKRGKEGKRRKLVGKNKTRTKKWKGGRKNRGKRGWKGGRKWEKIN